MLRAAMKGAADVAFVPVAVVTGFIAGGIALGAGFGEGAGLTLGVYKGAGMGDTGCDTSPPACPTAVTTTEIHTGELGLLEESIVTLTSRLPLIGVVGTSTWMRRSPEGTMRRVI